LVSNQKCLLTGGIEIQTETQPQALTNLLIQHGNKLYQINKSCKYSVGLVTGRYWSFCPWFVICVHALWIFLFRTTQFIITFFFFFLNFRNNEVFMSLFS
jgi:hypothetical protein